MSVPIVVTLELPEEAIDQIALRVADHLATRSTTETGVSEYLTVREAAELLRCKRQRVDDLLSSRRLARYKDGRRTLLRRDEVAAYLDRHDHG